jgi:hypothetical protein
MFEDRSIAWMMSGGNRFEDAHQRLDHVHVRAMRETSTTPRRVFGIGPIVARAQAALGLGGGIGATAPDLDCCVA